MRCTQQICRDYLVFLVLDAIEANTGYNNYDTIYSLTIIYYMLTFATQKTKRIGLISIDGTHTKGDIDLRNKTNRASISLYPLSVLAKSTWI